MKTKIPLLIVASIFIATITRAQYGGTYIDARLVVPGPVSVAYGYNHFDHDRFVDRNEWRGDAYERFYRDHRDWREDEYQRYCRYHREYRGDRDDYYRAHYDYRTTPRCAPRRDRYGY